MKYQRQKGLTCSAEGCGSPATSKGLCKLHYAAEYRAQHAESLRRQKRESAQRIREDARRYRELQQQIAG
jgi:hypothetical protein